MNEENNQLSRRHFIKTGAIAGTALMAGAVASSCNYNDTKNSTNIDDKKVIATNTINNSDLNTMEIIAINGSPRKNGNTAAMCKHFLDGASSAGKNIGTTQYNLYDFDYKGCWSCFGCKRKDSQNYGFCVQKDGITDLIAKVSQCDGIVFASPIYLGDITGMMRSFLERLLFPYLTYEAEARTIAPKRMPTAMIYTMNVTEKGMHEQEYDKRWLTMENVVGRILQQPKLIYACNTYQFNDYNLYHAERFSEKEKAAYKAKYWEADCKKAFDVGKDMAGKV
jgi:multimeric flavodoxin WrbA